MCFSKCTIKSEIFVISILKLLIIIFKVFQCHYKRFLLRMGLVVNYELRIIQKTINQRYNVGAICKSSDTIVDFGNIDEIHYIFY